MRVQYNSDSQPTAVPEQERCLMALDSEKSIWQSFELLLKNIVKIGLFCLNTQTDNYANSKKFVVFMKIYRAEK